MPDLHDLAERAVAARRWCWLPGSAYRCERGMTWRVPARAEVHPDRTMLPALDDPATIGCLWALVRDAHGGTIWAEWRPWQPMQGWVVWRDAPDGSRRSIACAPDVVEVLVCALEAAP